MSKYLEGLEIRLRNKIQGATYNNFTPKRILASKDIINLLLESDNCYIGVVNNQYVYKGYTILEVKGRTEGDTITGYLEVI